MWWALALLQARDSTDNRQLSLQFLETATAIWHKVVLVWDNVCGGGVYWDDTLTYKNAVTNELFLSTSTALYRATQNVTYLNWARKEMSWLRKSGLINEEFFVVVDGLKVNGSICLPPAKPTIAPGSPGTVYSYNQGLLLRGMADLAKKANDTREEQELLELAINLTSGSMAWLSKGSRLGIIQDPMWNDCNGPMFKGVYLRYLGYVATWFAGKAPSHFHRLYKFVAIQTWAVWHIARKIGWEMSPTLRSDTSLFWASWRGTRSGSHVVYNSTYPVFIPQTSALDAFNTGVVYQKISSLI
jgi:predicted alpha-1,6-mannanase (GH76 family)